MAKFADTVEIIIRSGKGGDGHVSFRRELYVPDGGPDGGDGGNGGNLILEVDKGLNNLSDFRYNRTYAAEDGQEGGKKRCHGRNGNDLVVKVPYGTVVYDAASGKVITDMSGENLREVLLKGGRGGLGNMHFATATMQAPRYSQPGKPGIELKVRLELKVIADAGLVGFPNVGKSSLITACSNARPEIGNYHFTTLSPHLGVVSLGDDSFVMADIPGIIEGASEGAGLGTEFLKHIARCRVLVHVVDAVSFEGREPVNDIIAINRELFEHDPELLKRPMIIAANKLDLVPAEEADEILRSIKEAFPENDVFPISAATGRGVKELIFAIARKIEETGLDPFVYEKEFDPETAMLDELPLSIKKEGEHEYSVGGERIEKMLGYTNLESEKGFNYFQNYFKEQKIIDQLKKLGLTEGDTVKVGGMEFEYYD